MRGLLTSIVLSSHLLSLRVTALPHPQVDDTGDTSAVSSGTPASPGIANPFPNAGEGADPGDGSVVSTPSTLYTTSSQASTPATNGSVVANVTHVDPPVELTGQLLGMPNCNGAYYNPKWNTCDQETGTLTSRATPKEKRQVSELFCPAILPAGVDPPDGCNLGNPPPLAPFIGEKAKRQASENTPDPSNEEEDPTVLNGLAGVDDGATPRKHNFPLASKRQIPGEVNNLDTPFDLSKSARAVAEGPSDSADLSARDSDFDCGDVSQSGIVPPPISPFTGDLGKRKRGCHRTAAYSNGDVQKGIVPPPISPFTGDLGKRGAQEKTPGNINFYNTPFELPQESGTGQSEPGNKTKRQGLDANHVNEEYGPLKDEDQVLDGSHPYALINNANKTKRRRDNNNYWSKLSAQSRGPAQHSSNVEVRPPGPNSNGNNIIKKRRNDTGKTGSASSSNSNDPTGYLANLGNSGSGINYENPSVDPATPPKKPGKRAQPDFDYVPTHHGVEFGPPGPGGARNIIINKRNANDSNSSQDSTSNDPTGYLGALGEAALVGNDFDLNSLPRGKKTKREPAESDFDSAAPHHDGNYVEVGPPGPDGASNIIINRQAPSNNTGQSSTDNENNMEDPTMSQQTQSAVAADQGVEQVDGGGGKLKAKRGKVFEDAEGKLVVSQAKREEIDGMIEKRDKVRKTVDGKLVVSQAKRDENDDVIMIPMPKRRSRIVRRDDMTGYKNDIPKQEMWYEFGLDYGSEDESSVAT